ncbi:hypothetical protein Y032_0091g2460 [Ancylostoma ceylanicum]|uniref:Uncharacterized protein n=1 Tax=Ancylostoma ceylanicum TaxID=53326 RepID=A0A016TMC0_9BILA|nr:hypothetical protein Y032_0091g2460 [Ancylostoma ceylanicum]
MLDEVDVVTHIELITDAIKSLEQKLGLFARSLEERIDSTIQRLEMRMRAYNQVLDTLLDRSKPRSNCMFWTDEDNRDATGSYHRYADAIARAMQANVMGQCTRCLNARDAADSGVRCIMCR